MGKSWEIKAILTWQAANTGLNSALRRSVAKEFAEAKPKPAAEYLFNLFSVSALTTHLSMGLRCEKQDSSFLQVLMKSPFQP